MRPRSQIAARAKAICWRMCEQTDSHKGASRAELRGKLGSPVLAVAVAVVAVVALCPSRPDRASVEGSDSGTMYDSRRGWGIAAFCSGAGYAVQSAQGRGSRVWVAGWQKALVVLSRKVPMTRNWMLWLKRWGAG